MSDFRAKLAAPFSPQLISWRLGALNREKTRGMALAYIDARDVMNRLDEACGILWQSRHPWASETLISCEIGIKVGDEWIWRGDGAGEIEVDESLRAERKEQQKDMARKAAFSDSFKRAAVQWGVGRYLYDLDAPWVDVEQRGSSYIIAAHELAKLRSLLPRPEATQKPAGEPSRPAATNGAAAQPSHSAPRGTAHPRYAEAVQAKERLMAAIEQADTINLLDDIFLVNDADLRLIDAVSPKTYDAVMSAGASRKLALSVAVDDPLPL